MADARDYRVDWNVGFNIGNQPHMVKFVVEDGQFIHHMELSMLHRRSHRFKQHVAGGIMLPHRLVLHMPPVSSTTFLTYLRWVYRREVGCKDSGTTPSFARELHRLIKLYQFAEELRDLDAKDAATNSIMTAYIDSVSRGEGTIPSYVLLQRLCAGYNFNEAYRPGAISTWAKAERDRLDTSTLELLLGGLCFFEGKPPPHRGPTFTGPSKPFLFRMLASVTENPRLVGPGGFRHVSVCKYHCHPPDYPCPHKKSAEEMKEEEEHDALPTQGEDQSQPNVREEQGNGNDRSTSQQIQGDDGPLVQQDQDIDAFTRQQGQSGGGFDIQQYPSIDGPLVQQGQNSAGPMIQQDPGNNAATISHAESNHHAAAWASDGHDLFHHVQSHGVALRLLLQGNHDSQVQESHRNVSAIPLEMDKDDHAAASGPKKPRPVQEHIQSHGTAPEQQPQSNGGTLGQQGQSDDSAIATGTDNSNYAAAFEGIDYVPPDGWDRTVPDVDVDLEEFMFGSDGPDA
ncbi:hypothetical protein M409DRAFT_20010 [Zasmidium cellare ATCC 36951]|uniref:Uncharacterized protein n=1 Tax=Zasmidium cellare ATCC 36951 TaxID=1080233 RepID=A0A6A6CQM4_ZASCE|nr:uncharacterized protein M409DRAFT_20010 [Zasmidium cellare ATCC 36951]KAF2169597.1 hypothetical protein M409DRAFT_20010 [Zasmidium cellare ATCC 36951]